MLCVLIRSASCSRGEVRKISILCGCKKRLIWSCGHDKWHRNLSMFDYSQKSDHIVMTVKLSWR